MKKREMILAFFALAAILLVAGCSQDHGVAVPPQPQVQQPVGSPVPASDTNVHVVEITADGFVPQTVTIKQDEKVIFANKDAAMHWPASAIHPTHKVYPGSDIVKCGTAEQAGIFDACHGLQQGEDFSFAFGEKGSWKYHDHMVEGRYGTVVVE
ncbi:TPA: hypothetical protein HA231_04585 [Candidatus Woesearchaeota archaeon]|nr:hypothetical protein [Candidatus Woesearchaeota archaeon]